MSVAEKLCVSAFFKEMLGASLKNVRNSWGACHADTNQLFLRVWEDEFKTIDGMECVLILREDWGGTRKPPGYSEREEHINYLRNGRQGYGIVCTAADIHTEGARTIKDYDDESLLIFGRVIREENCQYAQVIGKSAVNTVIPKQFDPASAS